MFMCDTFPFFPFNTVNRDGNEHYPPTVPCPLPNPHRYITVPGVQKQSNLLSLPAYSTAWNFGTWILELRSFRTSVVTELHGHLLFLGGGVGESWGRIIPPTMQYNTHFGLFKMFPNMIKKKNYLHKFQVQGEFENQKLDN